MKTFWQNLAARYDALQRRERWLIAVALLGGIVLIGYSMFIDPALKRMREADRLSVSQQEQLIVIKAQMAALRAPDRNPDVAAQAELGQIKLKLGALAERFHRLEESLVPPQQMSALLEDMIGPRSGLRLLSLKTLPATPFVDDAADDAQGHAKEKTDDADGKKDADTKNKVGLYKHGVEIRLEGSYQDLTAYLERLERSKMKLLWSSVALSAERHPHIVMTLTVYSLSLDRTWLIV